MNASPAVEREEASETDLHRVVLVADRVSKAFPGVLALDDVSFEVRASEVNALVGENGAGKSTLIKLMAGFIHPTGAKSASGETRFVLIPPPRMKLASRQSTRNIISFRA